MYFFIGVSNRKKLHRIVVCYRQIFSKAKLTKSEYPLCKTIGSSRMSNEAKNLNLWVWAAFFLLSLNQLRKSIQEVAFFDTFWMFLKNNQFWQKKGAYTMSDTLLYYGRKIRCSTITDFCHTCSDTLLYYIRHVLVILRPTIVRPNYVCYIKVDTFYHTLIPKPTHFQLINTLFFPVISRPKW